MGDIKVIAPGLGLKPRRAIRGDAVAERTVDAAEIAGAADFLRQLRIAPHAFDENSHIRSSTAASLDILYHAIHNVKRESKLTIADKTVFQDSGARRRNGETEGI